MNTNTYRVFYIYDSGNLIILFHGIQKKSQKTPQKEEPGAGLFLRILDALGLQIKIFKPVL
jgi:hypothetical protein